MVMNNKNKKNNKIGFFLNGQKLDNVTEFTYLGIKINAAGSFKPTLPHLSLKAERAIFSLNSKYKISKLPVKIALHIFQSSMQPILTYGSEVWSPYLNFDYDKWDICSIETVQLRFIKHILSVHTSATNNLVRREL